MKTCTFILLTVLIASCGGNLSDNQREAIRNSLRDGRIQRVSPAQLTEAGLENGRQIIQLLEADLYLANSTLVDSLERTRRVNLYLMKNETVKPGTKAAEIWEAYLNAPDPSALPDNLQKLGTDSLLYTRPITYDRPDGSSVLSHAVAVVMAVKDVIVDMEE